MSWILLALCVYLAAVHIGSAIVLKAFVRFLQRPRAAENPAPAAPRVAVLMPLRGADPCLRAAIQSVLQQSYNNFEVHIVVDSESDPAWNVAAEVLRDNDTGVRARLSALEERKTTCGLVCSALTQFLGRLDEQVEVIAFGAGDTVLPPAWLERSLASLSQPDIGSPLGNRWFDPAASNWGSLVRYLWNAAAVPAGWLFKSPWTCALALRRTDIERAGLVEKWNHAMVEDAVLRSAFDEIDLGFEMLPAQFVLMRDATDLGSCFAFLRRQLIWQRLYHPLWILTVGHGVLDFSTLAAPVLVAAGGLIVGRPEGLLAIIAWLAFTAGNIMLLRSQESAVITILRADGQSISRITRAVTARLFLAIPLAQVVSITALAAAIFARRVEWRGAVYRIDGPWKVELIDPRDG